MEANVKNVIDQIIEICIFHGDVDEIILYGSRAKGTHLPKSDIDIAIRGHHLDIDDLVDRVELIETLLKIDLVDIDHCRNELLKQEVERDGITLYRKI